MFDIQSSVFLAVQYFAFFICGIVYYNSILQDAIADKRMVILVNTPKNNRKQLLGIKLGVRLISFAVPAIVVLYSQFQYKGN